MALIFLKGVILVSSSKARLDGKIRESELHSLQAFTYISVTQVTKAGDRETDGCYI